MKDTNILSKELSRILNKGWVVVLNKQTSDLWDVKMAKSHYDLNNGDYCVNYGMHSDLDEALIKCEEYLLREEND